MKLKCYVEVILGIVAGIVLTLAVMLNTGYVIPTAQAQGRGKLYVVDSLDRKEYPLVEATCDTAHNNMIYRSGDGGLFVISQPGGC